MARASDFQTIRSEGGLLPPDLLLRVLDPRGKLEGTSPESYGMPQGERLNEVITQSWNRLCRHWAEFKAIAENLPEGEAATGPTNDKWTLPLLRELGFGTLPTSAAPEIEGRSYPIARFHGTVPLHLIGCGLSLDRRTAGARGAATSNPHGMVQEFLNRSQDHLWAIVSNGRQLRVLRDNQALSRQSYIEFDLEAMFNGQVYPDFVLMWMVAHVSRFLPQTENKAESCVLERWTRIADEEGTRALGDLRGSVAKALQVLGAGFTGNARNTDLQNALSSNQLAPTELHAELLRIVYRLIFLFVADDRHIEGQPLLHPRDKSDEARVARERYAEHYGTARLRELAGSIRGSRHSDLWRQFKMLTKLLSDDPKLDGARAALALPVLGGFLWNESATPHLNNAELTNHDFLEVLRHLAFTRQGKVLRSVDFRNLGAEELGGVYETLLELTPQVSGGGRKFEFAEFAGNERKTSGSYYTPDSLVQCLLDSALDPVVNEAIAGKSAREAEAAILNLKVCDPAVGSGHFLVGAAHRMARHLARARALAEGESEPSPLHYQHALRDVIGRCLYGVDINPMSAELCRVGLWLEAMEPGKPLSFLDHHIRVGNSLLGATPEQVVAGIADSSYTPVDGDDKTLCSALKRRNRQERSGQRDMLHLMMHKPTQDEPSLAARIRSLDEVPDDTPEAIRCKAEQFGRIETSLDYCHAQEIADTWCAATVWPKHRENVVSTPTTETLRRLEVDRNALTTAQRNEVQRLARLHRFFHWHLAFPEPFECGGFDCIIGNPPWEMMEAENGAAATDAASRRQLFYRSGTYELLNGRRDLYKLFLVRCASLPRVGGTLGFLTPLGVFVEDEASAWRRSFFAGGSVVQMRHFQNHKKRFFPQVHGSYRFCAITYSPGSVKPHSFTTVALGPDDIALQYEINVPRDDMFQQLGDDCSAIVFPDEQYALVHRAITRNLRTLEGVKFRIVAEFHASTDKALLLNERPSCGWAYLKNRNIHHFDHVYAPYEAWIDRTDVQDRISRKRLDKDLWFSRFPRLVFRDIARNDDERTLIGCLVPPGVVSTYDTPMFIPECTTEEYPAWISFYCAAFSAYLFDFLIRPVVDKHIKGYTIARIPWPSPVHLSGGGIDLEFFVGRILELVHTTPEFGSFAEDCGRRGPPFRRDDARRFAIRCELDAALFWLYLPCSQDGGWPLTSFGSHQEAAKLRAHFATPRDAISYVMDSFPIVRRKEEKEFDGEYRSKRAIIEMYDAIASSRNTARPYQTNLDPPPAGGGCSMRPTG